MKTAILIISIITFTSLCIAQDYQPFNETSSKRFFATGDPTNNDFFFHSENSSISNDSIIIDQYHSLQDGGPILANTSGCNFTSATNGYLLDTTWLGNKINWNSISRELILENELNEILRFDFGLLIGSSAQFYSDGTTNYFIEHASTNHESFLSVSDSVQIYTINAFDLGGTPVSSPLNNFEIKVSKNYGLLSFIDCYNFPNVQQGYELQGQTNPLIGSYQLTYEESYPWYPGDVIQYSSYKYLNGGAPTDPSTTAHQRLTITNRLETADSVTILFTSEIQETHYQGSLFSGYTLPTDPIRFKKRTPISERPWNMSQSDLQLTKAEEETIDWCGITPTFRMSQTRSEYCDSCQCYVNNSGAYHNIETIEYAKNIGKYWQSDEDLGFPNSEGLQVITVTYTNINGVECGTQINSQDELVQVELSVFPNPTTDILKIRADESIEAFRVIDISGRTINSVSEINQKMTEISLDSYQKGAYILEVQFANSIQTRRIIRE